MIYAFNRPAIRSAQLHEEIGASCASVRWSESGAGEITHDGTLTDAQIQAVIDAHVPAETNDEKMSKPAITAVIAALEAGTATNAQVQAVLAKVLRYIRRESV